MEANLNYINHKLEEYLTETKTREKKIKEAMKCLKKEELTYKVQISGYWPEYDQEITQTGLDLDLTLNTAIQRHMEINNRREPDFQARIYVYVCVGDFSFEIDRFDGATYLKPNEGVTRIQN